MRLFISIPIIAICSLAFWLLNHKMLVNEHFPKYTNVIVFGDSWSDSHPSHLFDNGNHYWKSKNGSEKISKNNTWVNYFIESKTSPLKHHHLFVRRSLEPFNSYQDNVVYAVASAQTGLDYHSDKSYLIYPLVEDKRCPKIADFIHYSCVPGIRKQIAIYLHDINYHPNPKTLFLIWGGKTDLFQNTLKRLLFTKEPLSKPIFNTIEAIKTLTHYGVPYKNIYILGLPRLPSLINLSAKENVKSILNKTIKRLLLNIHIDMYNQSIKHLLAFYTNAQWPSRHFLDTSNLSPVDIDYLRYLNDLPYDKGIGNISTLAYTYNGLFINTKQHRLLANRLLKQVNKYSQP